MSDQDPRFDLYDPDVHASGDGFGRPASPAFPTTARRAPVLANEATTVEEVEADMPFTGRIATWNGTRKSWVPVEQARRARWSQVAERLGVGHYRIELDQGETVDLSVAAAPPQPDRHSLQGLNGEEPTVVALRHEVDRLTRALDDTTNALRRERDDSQLRIERSRLDADGWQGRHDAKARELADLRADLQAAVEARVAPILVQLETLRTELSTERTNHATTTRELAELRVRETLINEGVISREQAAQDTKPDWMDKLMEHVPALLPLLPALAAGAGTSMGGPAPAPHPLAERATGAVPAPVLQPYPAAALPHHTPPGGGGASAEEGAQAVDQRTPSPALTEHTPMTTTSLVEQVATHAMHALQTGDHAGHAGAILNVVRQAEHVGVQLDNGQWFDVVVGVAEAAADAGIAPADVARLLTHFRDELQTLVQHINVPDKMVGPKLRAIATMLMRRITKPQVDALRPVVGELRGLLNLAG